MHSDVCRIEEDDISRKWMAGSSSKHDVFVIRIRVDVIDKAVTGFRRKFRNSLSSGMYLVSQYCLTDTFLQVVTCCNYRLSFNSL